MGEEKAIDKSLLAKEKALSNSHNCMEDQITNFIWEMKKVLGWLWAGISRQNDCMDGWIKIVQEKDKFGKTWKSIVKKLAENLNNITIVKGNENRFPEMKLGEGFPTSMSSNIYYKGNWPPSFEMILYGLSGTSNN